MASKEVAGYSVQDDPNFRIKPSQQMASACGGALLTSLIVTPFDVVKVRMQAQQKNMRANGCYVFCNGLMDHLCPCPTKTGPNGTKAVPAMQTRFTGTIDAFVKISRAEGIGSLWSGLGPTLVLAVPATMVYFVSYEQLRLRIMDRYDGTQPAWAPLFSGATARVIAVTMVSPVELIRTKMQSQRVSYTEIGQAVKSLLDNHGPLGLFKGLGSTLLRDVPFSAIYWMTYENIKVAFTMSSVPSFWVSFISGAASGAIAAVATNPFDVVKTHQQIELGEKEIFTDVPRRGGGSTVRGTFRRIYVQHGVRGLFSGLAPRLVKVAPACAIMVSSFEYGKLFFKRSEVLGEPATIGNFLRGAWQQYNTIAPLPPHGPNLGRDNPDNNRTVLRLRLATSAPGFIPITPLSQIPQPALEHFPLPPPNHMPLPAPNQMPLPAPNQMPLPAPNQMPVPGPNQIPVPAPDQMPLQAPNQMPVPAPDQMPLQAPNQMPAPEQDQMPLPEPVQDSLPAQERMPLPAEVNIPLPELDQIPLPAEANLPDTGPLHETTSAPDLHPAPGAGHMDDPAPVRANVSAPGLIPIVPPNPVPFAGPFAEPYAGPQPAPYAGPFPAPGPDAGTVPFAAPTDLAEYTPARVTTSTPGLRTTEATGVQGSASDPETYASHGHSTHGQRTTRHRTGHE